MTQPESLETSQSRSRATNRSSSCATCAAPALLNWGLACANAGPQLHGLRESYHHTISRAVLILLLLLMGILSYVRLDQRCACVCMHVCAYGVDTSPVDRQYDAVPMSCLRCAAQFMVEMQVLHEKLAAHPSQPNQWVMPQQRTWMRTHFK